MSATRSKIRAPRLPAGAFTRWVEQSENQRTYADGNSRLEITRHADVADREPKAVERLDVTDSVRTLAARVIRHVKAVKQSGAGSDQPVHLLYWPHSKDLVSQLFKSLIIHSMNTAALNNGTRLIDLSAALEWSPFLMSYISVQSLAKVASVNSHLTVDLCETEASLMQFLLRLAANPLVASPPLAGLVEYLDKAGCPKDLSKLLGESIAKR